MGRLFWKFFLTFGLALLAAGAGTTVWLRRNAWQGKQPIIQLMSGAAASFVALLFGTVLLPGCAVFSMQYAMLLFRRVMRLTSKTGNFCSGA